MGAGQAKEKSTADQIKLALPGVDVAKAPEFSWEEIRKHNSMDDCWVVLHGMVFDVSKFLFDHPGGAHLITGKAGQDITEAFEVNNHSQRARTLLVDFFKGKVAAVNANASQSSSTVSTSSSSPSSPPASSTETNNSSSSTTVSSTPSSPATPSSNASSLPSLKVLYATQKGAARRFAQMLAAEAISRKLVSSSVAIDLKSYEPEDLPNEQNAVIVFIMSTYTDGAPPDSGKFFCTWLEDSCLDWRFPKGFMNRVRYTVFGLGNSIYDENFNKVAFTVDKWMQVGGASRFVSCGVGDDNAERNDLEGTQETDFQAWSQRCLSALANLKPTTDASSGCCSDSGCACSSSSASLSDAQRAEILEDLAAEAAAEVDEEEENATHGEPLVDVEDMGKMVAAASGARTRRPKKSGKKAGKIALGNDDGAASAAAESEEVSAENEADIDDAAIVAAIASGSQEARSMITPQIRQSLTKQGYRLIGSHSGVKLCRWTKAMLRGRGGCYKHTCYGIRSYSCMEMTPSLACSSKCIMCWRAHTNPVGKEWKWQVDQPEMIVEQAVANHLGLIRQLKGVPGVKPERFDDAQTVRHCALSLVGEPIMYPHINRFLDLLHERKISSFLVTNAQHPECIRKLKPVTQLYLSIDAATPESLKAVDRPLFKDYWERFLECLSELSKKQTRTVYRLTLIKAWNMEEIANYASLIARGNPEFIEIKGFTYCGNNETSGLTMKNVPFHEEVIHFGKELLKYVSDDYDLASEHAHSCTLLIAHKKFRIDGRWHTWIDYDRFHALAATGQPFTSLDYAAPTPEWACYGHAAAGFDPEEERVYVKGVKKREMSQIGDGASVAGDLESEMEEQKLELDLAAINSGC